jgi:hypothetical protein
VGSEMCIRDRGTPAAEAVPSGFGTKGGFAKMTLWHRMAQDNQKLQTTSDNITTGNKPRYHQQQT